MAIDQPSFLPPCTMLSHSLYTVMCMPWIMAPTFSGPFTDHSHMYSAVLFAMFALLNTVL